MARHIGFIDMDAFFVSVERRLNPALIGRPVIVGSPPQSRGVVAAASYEVRAFGVRSAMPMATALRLAPHAVRVDPSRGHYSRYSRAVADVLAARAPVVRQASIDEFYLDLTGCERLHGGNLLGALERIKIEIAGMGLPCTAALASGPLTAKIAATVAKPDGLIEIPPGGEKHFLAGIAIEEMPGIGPILTPKLKAAGFATLGDIQRSDPGWWQSRFGPMGLDIHRKASGIETFDLSESQPAHSCSREATFPVDTRDREWIASQLCRYVEGAVGALRSEGRAARTGTLKIRYADFKTHTHAATIEATDDEAAWWRVARDLLARHLHPDWPVRLIGFRLSGFADPNRQPSLFEARPVERRRLAAAVDRLRDRFGEEALHLGRALEVRRASGRKDGSRRGRRSPVT